MTLREHTVAAFPLMAGVYVATRSLTAAVLAGASSVLIDVDHVPDYVYFRGGWRGLRDFFRTCYQGRLVKTFVLFHAWEWAIGCWMLILAWSAPQWILAVAAGITYHLVLDQVFNPVDRSFYWISCRARHGFVFALFSTSTAESRPAPVKSAALEQGGMPTRKTPYLATDRSVPIEP